MPKYIIQHTPVKSGSKRHEVGKEMELAAKTALTLGGNEAPVSEAPQNKKGGGRQ